MRIGICEIVGDPWLLLARRGEQGRLLGISPLIRHSNMTICKVLQHPAPYLFLGDPRKHRIGCCRSRRLLLLSVGHVQLSGEVTDPSFWGFS